MPGWYRCTWQKTCVREINAHPSCPGNATRSESTCSPLNYCFPVLLHTTQHASLQHFRMCRCDEISRNFGHCRRWEAAYRVRAEKMYNLQSVRQLVPVYAPTNGHWYQRHRSAGGLLPGRMPDGAIMALALCMPPLTFTRTLTLAPTTHAPASPLRIGSWFKQCRMR